MGWLDAKHSFSFGSYHDPDHMGFGPLRVINEDRIQPGQGFGMHGHKDMEIVTYIIDGALEHRDNMGNGSVIRRGDVQRMSAGTGVMHSEFNHSDADPTHLLQIWVLPERDGIEPGYEERTFDDAGKRNQLRLIASRDARGDSLRIHQDVDLYASILAPDSTLGQALAAGRVGWVQVVSGSLAVNGERLSSGDGASISGVDHIAFEALEEAEFLYFDMG